MKIGSKYLIEYEDAAYSNLKSLEGYGMPKRFLSIGYMRRIEEEYIDLAFNLLPNNNETIEFKDGVIIPRGSIIKIKELDEKN